MIKISLVVSLDLLVATKPTPGLGLQDQDQHCKTLANFFFAENT